MNKANFTAYEVVTEENLTDIHSAHRLRTAQVWHISWSTVYSAVQGNFH